MISKVDLDMDMMDQAVEMAFGNKQLNDNLTEIIQINYSKIGFMIGQTKIIIFLNINI